MILTVFRPKALSRQTKQQLSRSILDALCSTEKPSGDVTSHEAGNSLLDNAEQARPSPRNARVVVAEPDLFSSACRCVGTRQQVMRIARICHGQELRPEQSFKRFKLSHRCVSKQRSPANSTSRPPKQKSRSSIRRRQVLGEG